MAVQLNFVFDPYCDFSRWQIGYSNEWQNEKLLWYQNGIVDTIPMFKGNFKIWPSRYDSWAEYFPGKEWSKLQSELCYSRQRRNDENGQRNSSKCLKEKYNACLETVYKDCKHPTHKWHVLHRRARDLGTDGHSSDDCNKKSEQNRHKELWKSDPITTISGRHWTIRHMALLTSCLIMMKKSLEMSLNWPSAFKYIWGRKYAIHLTKYPLSAFCLR